jgi:hypothetical protein
MHFLSFRTILDIARLLLHFTRPFPCGYRIRKTRVLHQAVPCATVDFLPVLLQFPLPQTNAPFSIALLRGSAFSAAEVRQGSPPLSGRSR